MQVIFEPIGVIRTPYLEMAPFQPIPEDPAGEFYLELLPCYETALNDLGSFRYIIVLFHIDRARGYDGTNLAHPPSLKGGTVGLFASRSPNRPNPIGMDVTRLLGIEGCRVRTGGLSVLDGTPLLDIKPYIAGDRMEEPLGGWVRRI